MPKKNNHKSIDINADVGEGVGNDDQLIPYLSSCNIACGGHAGDDQSMTAVVKLALHFNVKIGAHPSFPDQKNFGRVPFKMPNDRLLQSLISQVDALVEVLTSENAVLHHIKPHGALYNLANTDRTYAEVVVALLKHYGPSVKLYAPYASVVAKLAKNEGVSVVHEAFADRNYNDDGTLVARSHPNALIEAESKLCEHVLNIIIRDRVITVTGAKIPIKAETVCIHGDHPQARHHLKALTEALTFNAIQIL